MIKFISKFISYNKLAIILASLIVQNIFELIGITLFVPIIDAINNNNTADISILYNKILNYIGLTPSIDSYLILLCCIFIIKSLISLFTRHLIVNNASYLQDELRINLFENFTNSSLDYIIKSKQGYLISVINQHTVRCAASFFTLMQLIQLLILTFVYLIFVTYISWELTLIAILLGAMIVPLAKWVMNKSYSSGKLLTTSIEKSQHFCLESFSSKKFITSMNYSDYRINNYRVISNNVRSSWYGSSFWSNILGVIIQPFFVIILSTLIALSFKLNLSTSLLGAFALAFIRLLPTIQSALICKTQYLSDLPSFIRVQNYLDESFKEKELSGFSNYDEFHDSIKICNVYFGYLNKIKLLNGINIEIPFGKIVGIVGSSGSGKTTIIDMLLGLYKPDKGEIIYDNININDINLKHLRDNITYITQEPILFNDTINNNLIMGLSNIDSEKIKYCCEMADAWSFISNQPDGLNTNIGDKGSKLSGGQRQRIALARALIRDSKILIMDEATSALDVNSELSIKDSIINLNKKFNTTIIIVAHRDISVNYSDIIYEIKEGKAIRK